MTLKAGTLGVLQLGENFDRPRWREALVVAIQPPWIQTLIRCSQEEAEATSLTVVEKDHKLFCVVEAQSHQLLSGSLEETMALNVNTAELLKEAAQVLASSDEDLNYATASEPKPISKGRKTDKKKTLSSSSSEDVEDEADVAQLRKSWLGLGLGEDSQKRDRRKEKDRPSRSKRFALLDKKKTDKQTLALTQGAGHEAMVQAAMKTGDPLQGLLALQVAQSLEKSGRRRKSRSSSSERSNSSGSDSSEDLEKTAKGHSRAVHNYTAKLGRKCSGALYATFESLWRQWRKS